MRNHWRSVAGDGVTHPAVRTFRVPKRMYELAAQQVEADAEFMARARQDIPALIAEFDRLRDAVHKAQLRIGALHDASEEDQRDALELLVTFLASIQSE